MTVSVLLSLAACGGGGDSSGDALSLGGSTGTDAIGAGASVAAGATWSVAFQEADGAAMRQGLSRNGALLAFTATATAAQGPRARLFDGRAVHELSDGPATAVAVNEAGQVAGQLQREQTTELFRWEALTQTTTDTRLGTPPDISSTARAINAGGVVTGNETGRRNLPGSALRWSPGAPPQGLAKLDPAGDATGLFINTGGAIAGVATVPGDHLHAVYWRAGEPAVVDLGTLGGVASAAAALNDSGQVAGQADDAQGNHRAFLWSEDTGIRDLGTLGGASATANDLNASGSVVGTADTAEGGTQAFLWADGAMRALGTLGGRASAASAINASGLVGGNSEISTGVQHAFVWSEQLGMVDLNDRVSGASPGVLQTVIAVADDGTVLASADGGALVLLRLSQPQP